MKAIITITIKNGTVAPLACAVECLGAELGTQEQKQLSEQAKNISQDITAMFKLGVLNPKGN